MRSPYDTRVLITAAVLAVALVGHFVGLPGAPPWDRAGDLHSIFPPPRFRLFALGILPYLSGAALWVLFSGVIGRLERMREGTPDERRSFDRGIVWIALILMQAIGLAMFLRTLASVDPRAPGFASIVPMVPSAVAGMALLVGMGLLITRAGIGNGVAWIALVTLYLAGLPDGIRDELARLRDSELGFFRLPIAVLVLVGLVVACCYYLQTREDLVWSLWRAGRASRLANLRRFLFVSISSASSLPWWQQGCWNCRVL